MSEKQLNAWNKKIAKALSGRTIADARMTKIADNHFFEIILDNGKSFIINRSDDRSQIFFKTNVVDLPMIPLEINL